MAVLKKYSDEPLVIIDGAHNPAGIEVLIETLKYIIQITRTDLSSVHFGIKIIPDAAYAGKGSD